jgi:hypothetical protein
MGEEENHKDAESWGIKNRWRNLQHIRPLNPIVFTDIMQWIIWNFGAFTQRIDYLPPKNLRRLSNGDTWSSDNKDFYVFQVDGSYEGESVRNQWISFKIVMSQNSIECLSDTNLTK